MRIAIIASPFIPVPPPAYGGTELFIADLAEGLKRRGEDVVVYTNGASTVNAEIRWKFEEPEWPLASELAGMAKEMDQLSWSVQDAVADCDLIHVNSAFGVTYSSFVSTPFVCTLHHPFEEPLTRLYEQHPKVAYAAISCHQARLHPTLRVRPIHHGLNLSQYHYRKIKQPYLAFLGRICPIKGTHLAIEIARRAGIPLKIAGEVQPMFRDYFESQIRPHIDGRNVEFLGEADLALKNELLGGAMGLLFPIQWHEPFGLVMVEAMACGTPVFAFPGGAVPEIVSDGVSGRICKDVDAAVQSVRTEQFEPELVREWTERSFSVELMVDRYLQYYRAVVEDPYLRSDFNPAEEAAF